MRPKSRHEDVGANKDLVKNFFEGFWDRGDTRVLDENLADDFEFFILGEDARSYGLGQSGDSLSREAYVELVTAYRTTFPDMRAKILEMIGEGDTVVIRYENSVTHNAPFLGIPGSGRVLRFEGIAILRLDGGKIRSCLGVWNPVQGLRQMIGRSD